MKKFTRFFVAALLLVSLVLPAAAPVSAATIPIGSQVNPQQITFGTTYGLSWDKTNYSKQHYSVFNVPQQGIVTINATKPSDDDGETFTYEYIIYDANFDLVMSFGGYYTSDSPKPTINYSIGLKAGTYYMVMDPNFRVTSGLITSTYSLKFTPSTTCEVELNEGQATANTAPIGKMVTGYFGDDGGDGEEADVYKFNVTAGKKYRISFKNYSVIYPATSTMIILSCGDEEDTISFDMTDLYDANTGMNYYDFTPTTSGTAYIKIYNYHKVQYEYNFIINEAANGWVKESGYWVFYENGVKVTNQWKKDSKGWCYLESNGRMATNKWIKDSQGWCYVGSNGYCVTNQWKKDSKGWCYLDANGRMAVNKWIKDSAGWCYVGSNGYCVTNQWKKDSKGWCYLDANGRMATNKWVKDSKGWCYVGPNGYAVTNQWKKDSHGWCYLDSEGSMVKNAWLKSGGNWYYLDANGYMVTGTKSIGGVTYKFSASGVWIG